MGDPRKIRKKYETPSHPWIKSRIEEEKRLAKEYGIKNKKEIWKAETVLKKFKSQAKNLIALKSSQAELETQHLFRRVKELGLIQGEASFDAVLGLNTDSILSRRLQTVLFKKGLARTPSQARQFIAHGHVFVSNKKITSPSYLVTVKEEAGVEFAVSSALYSADHPERASTERLTELNSAKEQSVKAAAEENAKKANLEEKAKREGIEEQEPTEKELAQVKSAEEKEASEAQSSEVTSKSNDLPAKEAKVKTPSKSEGEKAKGDAQ